MTSYTVKQTETSLWTTGFYAPSGRWQADSDYGTRTRATRRAGWLNGPAPRGYVYLRTEAALWTVGTYDPSGRWLAEGDHGSKEEAARATAGLNGSDPEGWRDDPVPTPSQKITAAIERVHDAAIATATVRGAYRKALDAMRAAVLSADQDGAGRNEIVRAAEGGLSRRKVYETLSAADLLSDARAALKGHDGVNIFTRGERVHLDLFPQIMDRQEGPEDEDLYPDEREQRDHTEMRRLEDTATSALYALRASGLTFADGDEAIEGLIRFESAEIVRRDT